MKNLVFNLTSTLAVALLAGCGGSAPSLAPPGAIAQQAGVLGSDARGRSWMLPETKNGDLLYVSIPYTNTVDIFTYPRAKLVGTLSGFATPWSLCSDKAGNVWIPNHGSNTIVEYAHGGTQPIATLQVPKGQPIGCSVDPTTGDLAVSGWEHALLVYKQAKAPPIVHHVSFLVDSVSYDGSGNLFADGRGRHAPGTGFVIGELPAGQGKFRRLYNPLNDYDFFGQLHWDGKYIDVSAYEFIFRLAIHGGKAVVKDQITIDGVKYVGGYWIQGSKMVATDWFGSGTYPLAEIYDFPAGGMPIKNIEGSGGWGVTVSLAK